MCVEVTKNVSAYHRRIFLNIFSLLNTHRIGQPLCLGQLVHYFGSGDNTISTWEAYLYATGVVLGSALYTFTHHPYFFECQHIGMQIRVAACSLVYKKVKNRNHDEYA